MPKGHINVEVSLVDCEAEVPMKSPCRKIVSIHAKFYFHYSLSFQLLQSLSHC